MLKLNITREFNFARANVVLDYSCTSVDFGVRYFPENVCVLGDRIINWRLFIKIFNERLMRP